MHGVNLERRRDTESSNVGKPRTGVIVGGLLAGAVLGLLFVPAPLASTSTSPSVEADVVQPTTRCGPVDSRSGEIQPGDGVVAAGGLQSLDSSGFCSGAPRGCYTWGS